ncbi:MAG: hypothetical protein KDI75_08480 [Xanthomonadales bacterium]|nr:hypothetical protein [Xanthomonadales bacterium]
MNGEFDSPGLEGRRGADRTATDPKPQPPEKPLPMDCCGSGCPVCVMDAYDDALATYREALAAWEQRQSGRDCSGPD